MLASFSWASCGWSATSALVTHTCMYVIVDLCEFPVVVILEQATALQQAMKMDTVSFQSLAQKFGIPLRLGMTSNL